MQVSEYDKDTYFSLINLIKKGGFFVSSKQRAFFRKAYKGAERFDTVSHYGVSINPDQYFVDISFTNSWADYGTRSIVPGIYVFKIDNYGICGQYKIGGDGNLAIGWSPNPNKVTSVWERANTDIPEYLLEEVKMDDKSEYVGVIGERIQISAKIVKVTSFEAAPMHYYDSGKRNLSILETDSGSSIVYFGDLKNCNVGDSVIFSAKVKEHRMYEGRKQTVVQRPTKIENKSQHLCTSQFP